MAATKKKSKKKKSNPEIIESIDDFLEALRVTEGPWKLRDYGAIRRRTPKALGGEKLFSKYQCPVTAVKNDELHTHLEPSFNLRLSQQDLFMLNLAIDNFTSPREGLDYYWTNEMTKGFSHKKREEIKSLRAEILRVTVERPEEEIAIGEDNNNGQSNREAMA